MIFNIIINLKNTVIYAFVFCKKIHVFTYLLDFSIAPIND